MHETRDNSAMAGIGNNGASGKRAIANQHLRNRERKKALQRLNENSWLDGHHAGQVGGYWPDE